MQRKVLMNGCAGMLVGSAALLLPGAARAAGDSGGRSVVVVVDGPDAERIATRIEAHLGGDVGDPQPFRAALAGRPRQETRIERMRAAAALAHADVAVVVKVWKSKRETAMHVVVVDPLDEQALADRDLTLPAGATIRDQADAAWGTAQDLVGPPAPAKSSAPAPAEASPSAPPSPVADAMPRDSTSTFTPPGQSPSRATTPFAASAGIGTGSRHFSYVQRITGSLRPYSLDAAPMVSAEAEFYPAAGSGTPFLSGLGVTGDVALAVGLASSDSAGTRVGTDWHSFGAGVRERIAVSPTVLLGIHLGYGAIDFAFSQDVQPASGAAQLPSVQYRFVRAGADARWSPGALSVFGGASGMDVVSVGYVGDLFPNASAGGVEARVGAAYLIARHFEVSLTGQYTRFFYSMNPGSGDANVAGGALDEMTAVSAAFGFVL